MNEVRQKGRPNPACASAGAQGKDTRQLVFIRLLSHLADREVDLEKIYFWRLGGFFVCFILFFVLAVHHSLVISLGPFQSPNFVSQGSI